MISKRDYIIYSLTFKLYRKMNWFFSLFAIQKDIDNEFLRIDKITKKAYVKVNGNEEEIIYTPGEPIFKMSERILINKDYVENLDTEIETFLGRIFINKILICDCVGNKISFIDKPVKTGAIEKEYAKALKNDIITVEQYLTFTNNCIYMHGLSRIVTVSATPKNILPPPGIEEFKAKIVSDLNNKYGPDWVKDRSKVVEFETALKNYDTEWLKGDPSFGKLISGKVKDGARTKMFLTYGAEVAFDKKSGKTDLVTNSLLEGYPKDRELLTNMFNTSRSGSYDRGKNTQKGGSAAKDILRATSSITITDRDCGDDVGKIKIVTEENYSTLSDRYIINKGKPELITDPKAYIGKVITIRSPMTCKEKGSSLCQICLGNSLKDYKTGISILVTDVSSILLATSMAAMHFKELKTIDFNILEAIK